MEKILARLQSEDDEFRGFFSPEKTAMMKRVLEQVCREGNIRPDAIGECESLAIVILRATKNNANESELLILGRHAVKNYEVKFGVLQNNHTELERAFQLARSGNVQDVDRLIASSSKIPRDQNIPHRLDLNYFVL